MRLTRGTDNLSRVNRSPGLRWVHERLAELPGQGHRPTRPLRGRARSPQVGVGTARSARRERSKPRRSARSKARRARARSTEPVAGPSGPRSAGSASTASARGSWPGSSARRRGTAGTSPSSSGIPASHTSPSASSAAGTAVRTTEHGQGGVDPDPRDTRRRQQPHRRFRRAAVDHHRHTEAGHEVAQQVLGVGSRHGPDRSPARRRRQRAGQHRGQARLVELDEHARPGALRDLGDVGAQSLTEAACELADGAAVGEHPVPGVQLDRRRERPRPGGLHLHPVGPRTGAGGVEGVDVEASRSSARRWSRPGRAVTRQPVGTTSTARSTSSAAVRPIMSAPTPRAGSSGRCGSSGSSPTTVAAASPTSVPGSEPTPVAAPEGQRTGSGSGASGRSSARRPPGGRAPCSPARHRRGRPRRARPRGRMVLTKQVYQPAPRSPGPAPRDGRPPSVRYRASNKQKTAKTASPAASPSSRTGPNG